MGQEIANELAAHKTQLESRIEELETQLRGHLSSQEQLAETLAELKRAEIGRELYRESVVRTERELEQAREEASSLREEAGATKKGFEIKLQGAQADNDRLLAELNALKLTYQNTLRELRQCMAAKHEVTQRGPSNEKALSDVKESFTQVQLRNRQLEQSLGEAMIQGLGGVLRRQRLHWMQILCQSWRLNLGWHKQQLFKSELRQVAAQRLQDQQNTGQAQYDLQHSLKQRTADVQVLAKTLAEERETCAAAILKKEEMLKTCRGFSEKVEDLSAQLGSATTRLEDVELENIELKRLLDAGELFKVPVLWEHLDAGKWREFDLTTSEKVEAAYSTSQEDVRLSKTSIGPLHFFMNARVCKRMDKGKAPIQIRRLQPATHFHIVPVSYTHLTLPTKRIV
eukprot:TRINITY_DN2961_c0_g1_i7.p1 TRINITY_DN2961_c0_g1~~TRINITY_DN2961_c0_g1_i7.p1  ORF type:complete len:399 (-),score=77.11 TRINITY_DN2961_c0_g1_i7:107-1303(-)